MPGPETNVLPRWRRRVMPWLMAAIRIAVAWLIFRGPAVFLYSPPIIVHVPTGLRAAFFALLAVGAPLFVWPRGCWVGGVALIAAIALYEMLWRGAGLPAGGMPMVAVGLIAVLVLGEWTGRLAQRRVYQEAE